MNERMRILGLIESGQISVEEGVQRLEALSERRDGSDSARGTEQEAGADTSTPFDTAEPIPGPIPVPIVGIVCQILFGVGVGVVAGGGLLLARAYSREGMPGLTWGWLLFLLGLIVMGLGWWLQRARWFYLRVQEHDGAAFRIALPLPLGIVVWLLRVAKPFVPQLQEMEADTLILAMRDELQAGRPLTVQVDEGERGDQVEIYFG